LAPPKLATATTQMKSTLPTAAAFNASAAKRSKRDASYVDAPASAGGWHTSLPVGPASKATAATAKTGAGGAQLLPGAAGYASALPQGNASGKRVTFAAPQFAGGKAAGQALPDSQGRGDANANTGERLLNSLAAGAAAGAAYGLVGGYSQPVVYAQPTRQVIVERPVVYDPLLYPQPVWVGGGFYGGYGGGGYHHHHRR